MQTSAYLAPKLLELAHEVLGTLPRIEKHDDAEGIHDLRVALRRLRTLLRLARDVFGAFHIDAIRGSLRDVANATGELRDEEVLGETLRDLALSKAAKAETAAWLGRRGTKTRELRERVVETLTSGALQRALAWLECLMSLPVRPEHDVEVSEFARRAARRAQRDVEHGSAIAPDDITAMHELRILYKRLRYALEGLEPALAPIVADGASKAAKFQKRLGELHDIDVAHETIRTSDGLDPAARDEVLAALIDARKKGVTKYLEEVAKHASPEGLVVPLPTPPIPGTSGSVRPPPVSPKSSATTKSAAGVPSATKTRSAKASKDPSLPSFDGTSPSGRATSAKKVAKAQNALPRSDAATTSAVRTGGSRAAKATGSGASASSPGSPSTSSSRGSTTAQSAKRAKRTSPLDETATSPKKR